MKFDDVKVAGVLKAFHEDVLDAKTRSEHDKWLGEAQRSVEAWEFCWQLLRPGHPEYVQHFGAKTLTTKIKLDFERVGEAEWRELRERVVGAFREYGAPGRPRVVLRKLAEALALFVLQSFPEPWPDPLGDLFGLMEKDVRETGERMVPAFFALLKELPVASSSTFVASVKRTAFKAPLNANANRVFDFGIRVIQDASASSRTRESAILSLMDWIRLKSTTAGRLEELVNVLTPLVPLLDDPETYLNVLSDVAEHESLMENPNTAGRIIVRLLSLEPVLAARFAARDFDELTSAFCHLFVAIGISHGSLLLEWSAIGQEESAQIVLRVLSIILQISCIPAQFPTEECQSRIAVKFWREFPINFSIYSVNEETLLQFLPFFLQALEGFLGKICYPKDASDWSLADWEKFERFRVDASNVISSIVLVKRDVILPRFGVLMEGAAHAFKANPSDWQAFEAWLFLWSFLPCNRLNCHPADLDLILKWATLLPDLPIGALPTAESQLKFVPSLLKCIQRRCIHLGPQHPQLLPGMVRMVLMLFQYPQVHFQAMKAMETLLTECPRAFSADLTTDVRNFLFTLTMRKPAGSTLVLEDEAEIQVWRVYGKMTPLLSKQTILTEVPAVMQYYGCACSPQIQSTEEMKKAVIALKILSGLFSKANTIHQDEEATVADKGAQEAILELIPAVLPQIYANSLTWPRNEEVLEALHSFLLVALDGLTKRGLLVAETVAYLRADFDAHTFHRTFTTCEELISKDDNCWRPHFGPLLRDLSHRAMAFVSSSSQPSEHCDLVAAFLGSFANILAKHNEFFVAGEGVDLGLVVEFACHAIHFPEQAAMLSAAQFLTAACDASAPDAAPHGFKAAVLERGGGIVRAAIVRGVAADAVKEHHDSCAAVVAAFVKVNVKQFVAHMKVLMADQTFPQAGFPAANRREFVIRILGHKHRKREIADDFFAFKGKMYNWAKLSARAVNMTDTEISKAMAVYQD